MIVAVIGFVISALIMVKAADYALRAVSNIEKSLHIGTYLISFFLVGLVSTFPEGFIAVVSSLQGVGQLGFGTLLGSTIADLCLVLGIVGIVAGRSKLSEGMKHEVWLLGLLMLPLLLAIDRTVSRIDGIILIGSCFLFFFTLFQKNHLMKKIAQSKKDKLAKQGALFLGSSVIVFVSAHLVVGFSQALATEFKLPLLVVGLVLLALATSLPELVFALSAAKKKLPDLAVGELVSVVILDATIIMGIAALINPITIAGVDLGKLGMFIVTSVALTTYFLRKGRLFTWRDGVILVLIYLLFIITELATAPRIA